MPKFNYMARNTKGVALSGEVVARSDADAIRLLRGEGKFVVRLTELNEQVQAALTGPPQGRRRVKTDEIIFFANQLSGMVDSGVTLADALEATIDQSPPGAFRRTIEDVIQRVQGGTDLSAALAVHPKVFIPFFVNMVRAAETTGTLGPTLTRIADYMMNQRDIRKKVKGALAYPVCMIFFSLGATIFLLTYVLPKFATIYGNKKAVLPLPTRMLMNTSDWIVQNWIALLVGIVLFVVGNVVYFRTARGHYTADWLRLNMPLLGKMFHKACLARMLRSLGSLISAGVSVLDAIVIARDVVGNHLFGKMLDEAHQRLQRGEQLSQALLDAPYLPRPVWQMINAGERTGQIGPSMDRVADLCENDLKHTIRALTDFIEPAMILVVGAVVGGIALAMLLPIFQISRIMAQ